MKFPVILLALSCAGCLHRIAPQPPDDKRIAAVYADLLNAAVEARSARLDSAAAAARADSVLTADSTSRQEFEAALAWYNADVQRWKPLMENLVGVMDERIRKPAKP